MDKLNTNLDTENSKKSEYQKHKYVSETNTKMEVTVFRKCKHCGYEYNYSQKKSQSKNN